MTAMSYRSLSKGEVPLIATIERSEIIDGRYAVVNGKLTLSALRHVVTGWNPSELTDHVDQIQHALADGGLAYGAWHESDLVGLSKLVVTGVGGDSSVMQLEPLHVSAPWRNQKIGRTLLAMVADAARSLSATSLYISSIPTRNTVDAYPRIGAVVLERPDPALLALEPEDIHMALTLPMAAVRRKDEG